MRSNNLLHLCFRSGQSSSSSRVVRTCYAADQNLIIKCDIFIFSAPISDERLKFLLKPAGIFGKDAAKIIRRNFAPYPYCLQSGISNPKSLPALVCTGGSIAKVCQGQQWQNLLHQRVTICFADQSFPLIINAFSSASCQELVTQCCKMRLGETTKAAFPVF